LPTLLSLVPTPRKDLSQLPFILFNEVYIDSRRGFLLDTSGQYIPCFYQIKALLHYLFILYQHVPLIFNNFLYSALYYIHI
jgi:hypothetical protein